MVQSGMVRFKVFGIKYRREMKKYLKENFDITHYTFNSLEEFMEYVKTISKFDFVKYIEEDRYDILQKVCDVIYQIYIKTGIYIDIYYSPNMVDFAWFCEKGKPLRRFRHNNIIMSEIELLEYSMALNGGMFEKKDVQIIKISETWLLHSTLVDVTQWLFEKKDIIIEEIDWIQMWKKWECNDIEEVWKPYIVMAKC